MSELKPRHTPLPWSVDGELLLAIIRGSDATIVAVRHRLDGTPNQANMRHIVHCVNAHEGLVEALEAAIAHFKKHHWNETFQEYDNRIVERVAQKIEAALAQAKGGE